MSNDIYLRKKKVETLGEERALDDDEYQREIGAFTMDPTTGELPEDMVGGVCPWVVSLYIYIEI